MGLRDSFLGTDYGFIIFHFEIKKTKQKQKQKQR
jgi:hypothetical protein